MMPQGMHGGPIAYSVRGFLVVYVSNASDREALSVLEDAVCVIGVFDGLHRGHRFLIDTALSIAKESGKRCVCITFDRDPDECFIPDFKKLMANEERIDALSKAGFDDVVVLEFTEELSSIPAEDFLDHVLSLYPPFAIVVAKDFRFGNHAQGDTQLLKAWGDKTNVEIDALELFLDGDAPITSTRIRALLREGDVKAAEALLGRPFSYSSTVLPGRQAGRDMGFRTANLHIPDDLCVLEDGVYAAYVRVGDRLYKAGVSVGIPPTFEGETQANVEAHILDFSEDIYGQSIEVLFKERLRDMRRFDDVDELIATINHDFGSVRRLLG